MMKYLFRLFFLFSCIKFRYLLHSSLVIVKPGASLKIGKNVRIVKSRIVIGEKCTVEIQEDCSFCKSHVIIEQQNENVSSLRIGKACSFRDTILHLKGNTIIGNGNIFEKGDLLKKVPIRTDGEMVIGDCNRLRVRIWSRYKSRICIGSHNNINENSEIRCDESVTIGDFNQISYECLIWDTNTHVLYKAEKRRELTITKYPIFGYEYEKPKTASVKIGSDCWVGRRCSIFKGTVIGNNCIIGFGTMICNKNIQNNKTVVEESRLNLYDNEI